LRELPHLVQKLRLEAVEGGAENCARGLTLLWDDATRPLQDDTALAAPV
jgi:hypothetical protein